MAVAYFTQLGGDGVSLNAANWTDTTGFANDATLVIGAGTANITADLDRTGSTTTGIDYLHITEGFAGTVGSSTAGSASIEFDATYTDAPNFVLRGPATVFLTSGATTITKAEVTRGRLVLTGGTITTLVVSGGEVIVQSGCTVTNYVITGGSVTELGAGGTAATTCVQSGGRYVTERVPVTFTVRGASAYAQVNSTTADCTTLTHSDGRVFWEDGNIATLVGEGNGKLQLSPKRAVAIGGTALIRRGGYTITGRASPLVSISNEKYEAGPDGGEGMA